MLNVRIVLIASLLSASAISHARADTYPKNPSVDVLTYTFQLTLSDDTDEIIGETTIDLRFVAGGVTSVELDLVRAGADAQGRGMTVTSVSSAGQPLQYQHERDRLRIALSSPSKPGQRSQFTVDYRGVPASGLRIGRNKHGDRTFFSDNWPDKARHWLPTLDHPSDKAGCEFIVTAPAHYQVISNGARVEETDLPGSLRRTTWRESVPIATWLYVLGVARFAVQHVDQYAHIPIETWVYMQDRDAGFYDFAVPVRDVLEFYSNRVGPYSYEKLANVQAAGIGGGMEAATAIFYGESSVTGKRDVRWRNVIIHEMAHQWFGNAVTERDWDDVWLSEGFATYFTSLFIEHAYGRDEFVTTLKRSRDSVRGFDAKNPKYRLVHDNLSDMSKVTTSQHYQKGAWTLHMLRGQTGDEKFWNGIRRYYQQYRDRNASTSDFRRVMEETSGQDLGWFFDQWLYQPGGMPRIQGSWRYDAQARRLEMELNQVQTDGALYRLPIEVGLSFDQDPKTRVERVTATERQSRFTIPLDREPTSVVLDPNVWVLMDADLVKR